MTALPSSREWGFDDLPAARAYLQDDWTFDRIASLLCEQTSILSWTIQGYRSARSATERALRQVIFRIDPGPRACDLFFNARDGVRGRYWRRPDLGAAAEADIIRRLMPALLTYARAHEPERQPNTPDMSIEEVQLSLSSAIAKIWPDERGGFPGDERRLRVPRWEQAESRPGGGPLWRWTPCDRALDIKGALLDANNLPFDPKQGARPEQIHKTGFT